MNAPTTATDTAAAALVVRRYHERSKHSLQRYAAGPETLDWDAQPDPFRRYLGAPLHPLPLPADALAATGQPRWRSLFAGEASTPVPPLQPMRPTRTAVGLLFELSFALTAWKQQGPDRWAVRCNPSSGNLHPTEAYLLAHGVSGLDDGLYHYAPREHALEQRVAGVPGEPVVADVSDDRPHLWLGLSSIQWREAWKYGERAFRYCQLDTGHALGAVRYAAAVLGWRARVVPGRTHAGLAALLGLDREADFGKAEREEPELLVELLPGPMPAVEPAPPPSAWPATTVWAGTANRLDRHPMYRWPIIDEVAAATRGAAFDGVAGHASTAASEARSDVGERMPRSGADAVAVDLIRQRRSAQRFDARAVMTHAAFAGIVQALLGRGLPWDVNPLPPRVHPLLFVQRVEGVLSGAYALPRSAHGEALMRRSLNPDCAWQRVPDVGGAAQPLRLLAANPALAGALRTMNCHQALGSDAMLGFALLGETDRPFDSAPAAYRDRLHEAGLLGQVLYLEAEAAGLRGTGIGCFFDEALHAFVGLRGTALQSLYHFTIGLPLADPRIGTEPPYPERGAIHD